MKVLFLPGGLYPQSSEVMFLTVLEDTSSPPQNAKNIFQSRKKSKSRKSMPPPAHHHPDAKKFLSFRELLYSQYLQKMIKRLKYNLPYKKNPSTIMSLPRKKEKTTLGGTG